MSNVLKLAVAVSSMLAVHPEFTPKNTKACEYDPAHPVLLIRNDFFQAFSGANAVTWGDFHIPVPVAKYAPIVFGYGNISYPAGWSRAKAKVWRDGHTTEIFATSCFQFLIMDSAISYDAPRQNHISVDEKVKPK